MQDCGHERVWIVDMTWEGQARVTRLLALLALWTFPVFGLGPSGLLKLGGRSHTTFLGETWEDSFNDHSGWNSTGEQDQKD